MSKSLGTGVDPLETIAKVGADALRFALMQQAGKNQDIRFSEKRVENVRNFGNKIWNASRFVIMNLEDYEASEYPVCVEGDSELALEDRWILSRLNKMIEVVNTGFTNYDIDDAANGLYEFIWSEFCDWYIELAKPRLRSGGQTKAQVQGMLVYVLDTALRLLHPIMPFLTEEIWQALPHEGESIMVASFPEANASLIDETAEHEMETVMDIVRAARNLRAELGAAPSKVVDVLVVATGESRASVERNSASIKSLARIGNLAYADSVAESERSKYLTSHLTGIDLYIEVAGLIDVEKELARIDSELKSIGKELARSEGKLANEQFVSKAPAAIIEKERRIVAELAEKRAKLMDRKHALAG